MVCVSTNFLLESERQLMDEEGHRRVGHELVIIERRSDIQAGSFGSAELQYGLGGIKHSMRKFRASGGFVSFDAPIAYFGLGEFALYCTLSPPLPGADRDYLQVCGRDGG